MHWAHVIGHFSLAISYPHLSFIFFLPTQSHETRSGLESDNVNLSSLSLTSTQNGNITGGLDGEEVCVVVGDWLGESDD